MLFLLSSLALADIRVAVVEFTNAADDDALDALGKGLQSMLTTDLSGVQQVTLVERTRLTEIQDELKLGEERWVDPATAAKVGKLAGATHLLGGSFTVVGDKMRLDARIFDVQTSKVLLAEDIAGAKDAFFELEKQLVNKLVETLKVELTPKERASVRRIHTADFDAFKDFSDGIEAFDEKRYDDAMARLGTAVEADEDFKLARITLEQYGEIIAKIRARADAIDADRAARERLAELASDREDTQIVTKLIGYAGGDDTRKRVAALHLLALFYDSELKHQDRFMKKRARDAYHARYFAEAQEHWPKLYLFARGASSWGPKNVQLATFDQDFAAYTRMVWEGVAGEPDAYWDKIRPKRVRDQLDDRLWVDYLAGYLHLDRTQEVELYERVMALRAKAGRPYGYEDSGDRRAYSDQARRLTQLARFDESTAIYKKLADTTTDTSDVRGFAQKIEENAKYKQILSGLSGLQLEFAQLAMAGGGTWMEHRLKDWADEGLQSLNAKRRLDDCSLDTNNHSPTWVDGHAVWTMQQEKQLYTGPRTDPKRGTGFRYYRRPPYREGQSVGDDAMLLIDGIARDEVRIGFELTHAVPSDFAPGDSSRSPMSTAEATVDVLIGFRDIRTPEVENDVTREIAETFPPNGYAVRLTPDAVQLVRREAVYERSRSFGEWTEEVIASEKRKGGKNTKVEVEVKGEDVVVEVNGSKMRWKAPGIQRGFYGLGFRGEGFAAVDGLSIAKP